MILMGNLKELVYLLLKNKHVIFVCFYVFIFLAYLSALCPGAEASGQGIIVINQCKKEH